MGKFTEGSFNIVFRGPLGSGKTVAMAKVQKALEAVGYEVKSHAGSRDPEMDHSLSVKWKA